VALLGKTLEVVGRLDEGQLGSAGGHVEQSADVIVAPE
jgi:hypothetical protein